MTWTSPSAVSGKPRGRTSARQRQQSSGSTTDGRMQRRTLHFVPLKHLVVVGFSVREEQFNCAAILTELSNTCLRIPSLTKTRPSSCIDKRQKPGVHAFDDQLDRHTSATFPHLAGPECSFSQPAAQRLQQARKTTETKRLD